MNILIIEDDEDKSKKLEEFIHVEFPAAKIEVARSFNSGLRALIAGKGTISIILLDMSMPTYDISLQEPSGGAPENYAGKDLMAQMRLRTINIPVIIVTMFDIFGEAPYRKSLDQVVDDLKAGYSPPFRGYVYYNSSQEGWRGALKQLIIDNCMEC